MRNPRSLSHGRDFRRVLGEGRRARYGGIEAIAARCNTGGGRLGLAVRSSRGAVSRNRVKRRLREAYRSLEPDARYDVVVRADERMEEVPYEAVVKSLSSALSKAKLGKAEGERV